VATLAGMALANFGYLPPECKELKIVFNYLLPLAIPMLLFSADLRCAGRRLGRLLQPDDAAPPAAALRPFPLLPCCLRCFVELALPLHPLHPQAHPARDRPPAHRLPAGFGHHSGGQLRHQDACSALLRPARAQPRLPATQRRARRAASRSAPWWR
jgi:hypothetical protein